MGTLMRAMQFKQKGGNLELVQIPIPSPGPEEVRIKIHFCGVCHGEMVAKYGGMGTEYPMTPGHEVAGIIDELGEKVPPSLHKGDSVGVGWFGGSCGVCDPCREGRLGHCSENKAFGTTINGGYAEYCVVRWNAVIRIPKGLKLEEAAPLMCAGLTTFNALRHCGALAGDLVVVQGLGGLGHLGIQYARKMGFQTVAVSRGKAKEELAKQLGAHVYIDSTTQDVVKEIKALGGARIILGTVPDCKAVEEIMPALGYDGKFVLVGAPHEPVSINTLGMMANRNSLSVWISGTPIMAELTQKFSVLMDIKPVIEVFPLEKAQEAVEKMLTSKVHFRAVLENSKS